jgi:hypothetical protein
MAAPKLDISSLPVSGTRAERLPAAPMSFTLELRCVTLDSTAFSNSARIVAPQYCPEDGFSDPANAMQGKELNAILVFFDLKSEESNGLGRGKVGEVQEW